MAVSPEEQKKARMKAMKLLEYMDRTEKGLLERMAQEDFPEEAIQDALAYVKSFGYVNDLRYAQHYISYRLGIKSKQKIMQELYAKGVDRETAETAWEEAAELEEPDEKAMIRKQIEKKYEPGTELNEKEMRRLYGQLARKGFRSGDIFSVLEDMKISVMFTQ